MLPALLDFAPAATAAGSGGRLWFSSGQPALLGYVDPNGQVKEFFPPAPGMGPALGISAGSDADLWFIEESAGNRIGRIDPQGDFSDFPIPSGHAALSIAAGPDGNIWFTEANGIGWINPSTGIISEVWTYPGSPAHFSLAADGSPLLSVGQTVEKLNSVTILALANQSLSGSAVTNGLFSDSSSSGGNSTTGASPVFSSWRMITFMISLASPGPTGAGNSNGQSTPGAVRAFFAFAVPTHATDQVTWTSLADHGVPGQEASGQISADSMSGLEPGISTISQSFPAEASSFEAVRSSGTAQISATIDGEINSKGAKVGLDAKAETAIACQICGALATANESCQITKPVTDEEVRQLAHSISVNAPTGVLRELLAATLGSPWENKAVQDAEALGSILPALQGLPAPSASAPPDRNALLAIARAYRRHAPAVSPARANATSKPRTMLTRMATAWFVLQSVTMGIGRVVRHLEAEASHHPTRPA